MKQNVNSNKLRPLSSISSLNRFREFSSNKSSQSISKSNISNSKTYNNNNQSTCLQTNSSIPKQRINLKIKVIEDELIPSPLVSHKFKVTPFTYDKAHKSKHEYLHNESDMPKLKLNFQDKREMKPRPQTTHAREVLAHYNQIFNKDKLVKKKLKGKLINEINKRILVSAKDLNPEMFAPTYIHGSKPYSEKFRAMDDRLKVNIFTKKIPELLNFPFRNYKFMDSIITADELVYKNFTEKEIEMIKSDPNYFKINMKKFKDVDFFRHKTLIERLEEEEKMEHKKIKKNITGSIKKSLHELEGIMQTQESLDSGRVEKVSKVKKIKLPGSFGFKKTHFTASSTPRRKSILSQTKKESIDKSDHLYKIENDNNGLKAIVVDGEKHQVYENRRRLLSHAFKKEK